MNELQRRVVAGASAEMLGRGGKSAVAETSGMSRNTVIKAEREVLGGVEPLGIVTAPVGCWRPQCCRRSSSAIRWLPACPGWPTPTGSPSPPKMSVGGLRRLGEVTEGAPLYFATAWSVGCVHRPRGGEFRTGQRVLFLWDVSLDFWIGVSRLARASTSGWRVV